VSGTAYPILRERKGPFSLAEHSNQKAIEMRYLLGKLSDSEAMRLEQSYFADDSVFDNIEIAEDELIDAYVRDKLSTEDRKLFESKLLSSKRIAERVEFAKLLSTSGFSLPLDDAPAKVHWWTGLFDFSIAPNLALSGGLAAAVFLIVLGIPGILIWMQLRNESRRLGIERAAIEQQKQQLAQEIAGRQSQTNQLATDLQNAKEQQDRLQQQLQTLEEQLAKTGQPSTVGAIASILLTPNFVRGSGEPPVLNVEPSASTIKLKLALDDDGYNSYQATIKSPANPNVLTKELKPIKSGNGRIIVLQFPSDRLASGQYLISVSGRTPSGTYEPTADYHIRVSK
jgi:hypothetical protein